LLILHFIQNTIYYKEFYDFFEKREPIQEEDLSLGDFSF